MTERRPRVLIVDDEPAIREMLLAALKQEFEVRLAESGADALERLGAEPADAVLADQMMPGLTGIELLERVASSHPATARLLFTASDRVENVRDAVNRAHVHRFLDKPIRLGELREAIRGALREQGLEEENRRLLVEVKEKNALLQRALSEVQDHERRLQNEVESRTAELRAAMAELERLALRDGLTGLYNHRFFQEAVAAELARAARFGHQVGLVFLDVDHFKNYNDALGHPAGDELLRQLGRILTDTGEIPELHFHGRLTDIAARYGGEEFVLLLPQTDKRGTTVRAERLRATIEAFPFVGQEIQPGGTLTVSLGVAVFPDDAVTKQALIESADRALYRAKRGGRNRVRVAGDEGAGEPGPR